MTLTCIAIDDEPLALEQLCAYILKTSSLELKGRFESAFKAMEFLSADRVDLMFLDINMPDFNGLDFVRSLKEKPRVILTTAYSEYALEGFRIDALDYLLKPIPYTEFIRSVNKAMEWFRIHPPVAAPQAEPELFVKSEGKIVKIRVADILFVESANEYIRIHLDNQEVVSSFCRLKDFGESLPEGRFLRIHRSFIVNTARIKAVERFRVVLANNQVIPVGEVFRADFQRFVDQFFKT